MKIAYLINQYPRTSHSFIRREIRALESHGAEILRFSIRPSPEALVSEADREEQKLTRVLLDESLLQYGRALVSEGLRGPRRLVATLTAAVRLGARSDRGVLRHFAYFAEAVLLASLLKQHRAEHLHAHFGTNSAAVAMLCRRLGGPPFSFTVHGPEEFDKPEFLGLREKIRAAEFVVAISNHGRSQLWRWARREDWCKIEVVRCGLGQDLLSAAITPVPSEPRFVCVARMNPEKGHLVLLQAAARLAAEGRQLELVLIGDGPLRSEIEGAIERHHLGEQVRLAGWMSADDVRAEIVRSRALVLPSFAEGLPVVIMEALALGRPVITTAIAGSVELVQSGVTGWVMPAGSVDLLAEAMRAALDASPAELARMGLAGAERVARDHDASREAQTLAGLFHAARGRSARAAQA